MKIVDVRAHLLKNANEPHRWWESQTPVSPPNVYVRITTDEGIAGECITWSMRPSEFEGALASLRATLSGRDPHDVEAISYQLTDGLNHPSSAASIVDICLWDILGKHHEVPVYKLLGAARDRILAYASTYFYETDQEYVDLALQCRELGFKAFKLHAYGEPDKDIRVCRAVHDAVGDTMDLMLDPVNRYDRVGATKVARALQELDFHWLEAPISDWDIEGLADLTRSFTLQITAAESVAQGLRAYPRYLVGGVIDSVRGIGDRMGGISALRKSAALCEAFGTNFEPHSYGTTLVQAAHLNVMLAIHNCRYFELPVPPGFLSVGMRDRIDVASDGYVCGPTKPGLGYAVDADVIDGLIERELKA